ncbi:MAG: hypothetical protein M0C28_37250 [Candidatus Moduliflexus flocculans]|nr:hypothetical protein [Candidatus Moduliflexus flocculans]
MTLSLALATALYAAAATFAAGIAWRVWTWARTPEPFRIPTTTGQQRSLAWIAAEPCREPVDAARGRGTAGPRRPAVPIALQEHHARTGRARPAALPAAGLPRTQGALAGRDGAALVAARHRRPAPPAVCRSCARPCRGPRRARRVLRGGHAAVCTPPMPSSPPRSCTCWPGGCASRFCAT